MFQLLAERAGQLVCAHLRTLEQRGSPVRGIAAVGGGAVVGIPQWGKAMNNGDREGPTVVNSPLRCLRRTKDSGAGRAGRPDGHP